MKRRTAREGSILNLAIPVAPAEAVGDDVLEQLMVERYPDLVRLAFLILHDLPEAEDATQLALERAWRSRAQMQSADSGLFWLRRIVVREALRARSSRWRRLRSPLHIVEIEPPDGVQTRPDHAARLDMIRAFKRLSPEQSAVVALHHYFACPVAEVAEMLGIPPETVRSRLRLAMRKLREELQDA
jgi:RNA polymerase sigma-70 factor (ECF subfamily)